MKLSQTSLSQIETTIKKAIAKYTCGDGQAIVTDIHLQADQGSGELNIFDDDDEELGSTIIEEWTAYEGQDFYKDIEHLLIMALNNLKDNGEFDKLTILKPYSFVLVDEDKETVAELLLMDDDTLLINDELLKGLDKELDDFLQSPSKRIRTVLTVLYMRASKLYLLPEHYELLAAVELVHNASLIHDDVIDESKTRRQRKSLNEKFDNKLAVISGDYLLGCALKKFVKINSAEITDIFADTLKDMCKGEVKQYFNRFKKTDIENYIEKSTLKTSSLFVSVLKSSIILAGETDYDLAVEFAENFGIAFQIRDDMLNIIKNGKDIDDGIYNAPLILSENIDEGIEKTKILLNNYINCARHCVNKLNESVYKAALLELLELIENV